MSFMSVAPDAVATAASDLTRVGSALSAAGAAVAAPTTGIPAAAEDEVSAAIVTLFSGHGQTYQAFSAQAYVSAETANLSPLACGPSGRP